MASVDYINSIELNTSILAENINGDKKIKFSPKSYEAIKNFFDGSFVSEEVNMNETGKFTLIGRKPLKVKEDWVFTTNNRYLLNNEIDICNFIDVNEDKDTNTNINDVVVPAIPEVDVVVPVVPEVVLPIVNDEVNELPSVDSYLNSTTEEEMFKVSPISGKAKIERYEEVDDVMGENITPADVIPVVVPEVINKTEEVKDVVNVVPIRKEGSFEPDDMNVLELKEKLTMIKNEEEEQIRKNEEVMAQVENAKAIREKLEKEVAEALAKKKAEIEEKKRLEQEVLESLKREVATANELEDLLANI